MQWVRKLSDGIESLRAGTVGAIFADLSLPDSCGIDTLDRLLLAAPEVPVVVLCSLDDEPLALQGVQRGARDYLLKGYLDSYSFSRALHNMLERRAMEDALFVEKERAQGTGAALVTPSSLALIGAIYPKAERNRAVGVWAAASALTTAAGPVLGGWLTETYGWQAVFWINPPIAVAVVALLWAFAGADERAPRRFDIIGAGIIAAALGALAWSLSQIGHEAAADPLLLVAAGLLGVIGLVAYGFWERITDHPMTPPRLAQNRPFLALNIATLVIYAGLAIMFFLLPFDLIDRRGLSSTAAGLSLLPMALGVGLLSRPFGALADKIGARTMLIAGPLGAAFAFFWLAFAQNASLTVGVLVPMTLLGISFAALVTPLTASVLSSVAQADEGLASGVNNAASRVAQLVGVALGAGLGTVAGGHRMGFIAAAAFMLAGAAVMAISKTQR